MRQLFTVQNIGPVLLNNWILSTFALNLFAVVATCPNWSVHLIRAKWKKCRADEKPHLARALTATYIEYRCQFIKLQREFRKKLSIYVEIKINKIWD